MAQENLPVYNLRVYNVIQHQLKMVEQLYLLIFKHGKSKVLFHEGYKDFPKDAYWAIFTQNIKNIFNKQLAEPEVKIDEASNSNVIYIMEEDTTCQDNIEIRLESV